MTYNELRSALLAAGVGNADECRREAELICARFGNIPAAQLPFRRDEDIRSPAIDAALQRRIKREPLQYILGEWEFYGLDLYLTPDCLVPRPDTEVSVAAAISLLPHGARFADLGTGSGAIAVSVLKNRDDTHAAAVDIRRGALETAKKNAVRHGVDARCDLICADMLSNELWGLLPCPLDAVISNPPYIPTRELAADMIQPELEFEPHAALDGGADGLDFYRILIPRSAERGVLTDDGVVIFEVGAGESEAVAALGRSAGFFSAVLCDLGGIERTVILSKRKKSIDLKGYMI